MAVLFVETLGVPIAEFVPGYKEEVSDGDWWTR